MLFHSTCEFTFSYIATTFSCIQDWIYAEAQIHTMLRDIFRLNLVSARQRKDRRSILFILERAFIKAVSRNTVLREGILLREEG
jgi:hypothetical protein